MWHAWECIVLQPLLGDSRLVFCGLCVLAEKNAAVCGIDFQCVTLSDVQSAADFLRNDHTTEVIYAANDTSNFHNIKSFLTV